MTERFEQDFHENSPDFDREVKQVTHRDYKSYLNLFNLPEDNLARTGTVVDLGAGLSSFTEEARNRFSILRAVAVDPVYELIKTNPDITPDQLEIQSGVRLDLNPSYRNEGDGESFDADVYQRETSRYFNHFVEEVREHPSEYINASHKQLPLENESADLVLASNSILRSENPPSVIQRALLESIRILKTNGEIRIAGNMACFEFNPSSNNVELWYNGTLVPGGSWVKELEQTGHYSDPELMKVMVSLEQSGVHFYGVIASAEQDGKVVHRFDTLILRKDNKNPAIRKPEPETVQRELRKLQFQQTDGFNIPTVIENR